MSLTNHNPLSHAKTSPVVLVTGGTGYIGSHAVVALVAAGYDPIIVDNFSNSKPSVLERIATITGYRPPFFKTDLRDRTALDAVFRKYPFVAVIHFAGLKAVGESVSKPLCYYENNIESTLSLCSVMAAHGVNRLIFSSSATVYGDPLTVPIREDFPLAPMNPYGRLTRVLPMRLAKSACPIVLFILCAPPCAKSSRLR